MAHDLSTGAVSWGWRQGRCDGPAGVVSARETGATGRKSGKGTGLKRGVERRTAVQGFLLQQRSGVSGKQGRGS